MEQSSSKKVNAEQYISPYFREAWGIAADAELPVEFVSPKTLFTPDRLDIACKLYYIECLDKGLDMSFARELYKASIAAFSDGSFIEPGLKTKNGISDYYSAFDMLIADMKANGFDADCSVVPVGENGAILDGAHRVATAIYYDIPLPVVRIPGKNCCYNYAWFADKGMSAEYLDFMAYQFIRYTEKVYTVCLWPAAFDEKKLAEADRLIRKCADVAYKKEVSLNYHGIEQLMTSFYKHMSWTGSVDNGFSGVASKARDCYKKNAPTNVYVICGVSLDKVLELKQHIRDLYAIENSSVHITDTNEEAVEAGKLLLNQNSIDFMNYGKPFDNIPFVKELISRKDGLTEQYKIKAALTLNGIEDDVSCAAADITAPEDCFYFWGIKLPSIKYIKAHVSDENCLKALGKLEKSKSRGNGSAKENLKLFFVKMIACITGFFGGISQSVKRSLRVLAHRVKYRGQSAGKAKQNIENLQDVFLSLNTTTCDYLIMRNWEGFYDDILLEGHNDIDVLCRDEDSRDIMVRLLDAKPLTFDGFHYEFKYKNKPVTLDTRIMGDGYYDRRWQKNMLKNKKLHPNGFYIMDAENYYYSLMYHAIYQKKTGLSAEYAERLNHMAMADKPLEQSDFADSLNAFMKNHRYAYTETLDKSVVKNFGITDVSKKLRYPLSIRLRHAYADLKSKNLYQKLKIKIRNLIIRG